MYSLATIGSLQSAQLLSFRGQESVYFFLVKWVTFLIPTCRGFWYSGGVFFFEPTVTELLNVKGFLLVGVGPEDYSVDGRP